ncbi:YrhC family protein [Pseudalkalibacillus caeni]|uniref:YrhC-like protein n=1 Tax=Exobacillus caeni TaxID=2574798 RepID=A0A5R9F6D8_9BACL|nr:YrhC family protein [Pseudalkalibacillus caeni]TLS39312.1 hypothetical protein FCL54_03130 [Pseudalkalibacillus caeni]
MPDFEKVYDRMIAREGDSVNNKKNKILKDKITDYTRFGFILLSLSAFLYIGSLLPVEDASNAKSLILIGTSLVAVGFAGLFYVKAVSIKKKLHQDEANRM